MQLKTIAIIGSRGHYTTVLRELPEFPGVRLVGVADGGSGDSAAPVVAWARGNGHAPAEFGSDWRGMLDAVEPDMAVVCGPFELQATMSAEAIERGIHVMTEKPGALTWDDLAKLRKAHHRNPAVHLAGMTFSRYMPGFYTAWKLIRDGAIGDVRLIESRKSYKLGRRGAFYHRRESYGGTIPWVGSHAIDWVAWLAGDRYRSVFASHSSAHNGDHGTMERSALCHFTLTHGRAASIAIDVFRPDNAPSHGDDWARIVGTAGVIEVRPDRVRLTNADNNGEAPVAVACDRKPLRDFIDHVEGRAASLVDAASTLRLADACLRARQSADEGRVVSFEAPSVPPLVASIGPAVAALEAPATSIPAAMR